MTDRQMRMRSRSRSVQTYTPHESEEEDGLGEVSCKEFPPVDVGSSQVPDPAAFNVLTKDILLHFKLSEAQFQMWKGDPGRPTEGSIKLASERLAQADVKLAQVEEILFKDKAKESHIPDPIYLLFDSRKRR